MIKNSFALRVLALCFFLLALPLFIDTFIFFKNSYIDAITAAKSSLKDEGTARAFFLEEEIAIDAYLIDAFVYIIQEKSQDPSFSKEKLNELLKEFQKITTRYSFYVIQQKENESEIIAASDITKIGQSFKESFCYDQLFNDTPVNFIRRLFDNSEQQWKSLILAGKQVHLKNYYAKTALVVYSDISNFLERVLEPSVGYGKKYFAISQHEGVIFAASDPRLVGNILPILAADQESWKTVPPDLLGDVALAKKPLQFAQEENPPFFEFFFQGKVQLAYSRVTPLCEADFIVYSDKSAFFEKEIKNFLFIYCFYGIVLILGGGITFLLTRWLSRPLEELAKVMNKVAQNNLIVRFQKEPLGYEINYLGEVFNDTLDSLLNNMQNLEDVKVEKETAKKEIGLGKDVQNRLIPDPMLITADVEIEGRYRSEINVGGDFHDYSMIRNELVSLVVADSSGKGISSCLYALSLRSLLRSNLSLSEDLKEIIKKTNNSFLDLAGDTGMFVTLLMGIYDLKTKILKYYSCGNPPGLVLRGEEIIELDHKGLAMGLIEINEVEVSEIQLQTGDFVIFFTDGLISTMNPEGLIFAKKRLISAIKDQHWNSAKELVENVLNNINEFTRREHIDNELTLLVMKIK